MVSKHDGIAPVSKWDPKLGISSISVCPVTSSAMLLDLYRCGILWEINHGMSDPLSLPLELVYIEIDWNPIILYHKRHPRFRN
jgi:hypothetical protein